MIDILEQQGIHAKKEIIYLGIDDEKFKPPESKAQAKKALGLDPDRIVIGYLGRFGNEKDLPTLYSAFRKLGDEFDNISLMLVGGQLKQNFDNMENIKVFGQVDDPVPYYQAMDIYVLPSLTETTSLTTMEAMCCGLPVVVTPVGYVEKYVEHKFNGFVFPPGNSERLTLTLSNLLKNEEFRLEVGRAARKTISMKHSWRKTAEDIVSVLGRF
jgi:glycosyltransferase involved in cell wall biosynthesis